tara:strand:- start:100 stop:279 length:180 start_codon:yes stop_codon:yes gene_type:complete
LGHIITHAYRKEARFIIEKFTKILQGWRKYEEYDKYSNKEIEHITKSIRLFMHELCKEE